MKEMEAIIRPFMLRKVLDTLATARSSSMTYDEDSRFPRERLAPMPCEDRIDSLLGQVYRSDGEPRGACRWT